MDTETRGDLLSTAKQNGQGPVDGAIGTNIIVPPDETGVEHDIASEDAKPTFSDTASTISDEQPIADEISPPTNVLPADPEKASDCVPETTESATTLPPAVPTKGGGFGMVEISGPLTYSLVWRRCEHG
jgi:hypothetical protein